MQNLPPLSHSSLPLYPFVAEADQEAREAPSCQDPAAPGQLLNPFLFVEKIAWLVRKKVAGVQRSKCESCFLLSYSLVGEVAMVIAPLWIPFGTIVGRRPQVLCSTERFTGQSSHRVRISAVSVSKGRPLVFCLQRSQTVAISSVKVW